VLFGNFFFGRLIGAASALAAAGFETHAQDLEPRAYANTPVELNFLIGGYAYSKGTVGTDPSIPLEDTEVRLNSAVLAYVRTLDLWGRSGEVRRDITLCLGIWKRHASRATAQARSFRTRRSEATFLHAPLWGAGALAHRVCRLQAGYHHWNEPQVTAPLGQYDSDKLLNIGANRWSFKPEVGISKTVGPLTLELATGMRFYTDNNDFLDGKTLQINPPIPCRDISFTASRQGYGWGSMVCTIPAGARPLMGKKGKASRARAWALR
jgi:hypothetical protein